MQTGRRESGGGLIMWNIYDGVDAFLKNVLINNIVVNTRVRVQSAFLRFCVLLVRKYLICFGRDYLMLPHNGVKSL